MPANSMHRGWLSACLATVTLGAAQICYAQSAGTFQIAQLQSLERKGVGATPAPPTSRVPEQQADPNAPDTSGVWYYIRQRDMSRARAELDRLRSEHPTWRVPPDLQSAINPQDTTATSPAAADIALNTRLKAAEAAIRAGKPAARALDALLPTLQKNKDSGSAERLGRALFDARSYSSARDWFMRARQWAKPGTPQDIAAVTGLVKADIALDDWAGAQRDVALLPPGPGREQTARILSDAAATAAETAARKNDWAGAERLAAISEAAGPSRVRTDLGWAALDANDPARAAASFAAGPQNEDSRFGRILALSRFPGEIDALAAACAPQDRSARAAQSCGDGFAARALAAYNAGDWTAVIKLNKTAHELSVARSGTEVLAGWSYYRQNDYSSALASFDKAAAGEPNAAEGAVAALMAMNRYTDMTARAAADPRFAAVYRDQVGALAFARKRLLFASDIGAAGTDGMAAPSFTIGAFGRDKTGASGADQMTVQGVSVSGRATSGTQTFAGGFEWSNVRVGTPAPGAPVGSVLPSPVAFDRVANLTSPWLHWDNEGIDRTYGITVGTTPIGGTLDPLPTAALSAQRDWNKIIANVSLKAAPRYDSLLSMSGVRDGATGATWGRMIEMGPQAGIIALLSERLSLSAGTAYNVLRGKGVAHNDHFAMNVSLTYEIKPEGLDYLRIGPLYGFDRYGNNQNFFTLGNGGYYSPQAAHSAGAFVDFLTDEGKRWQIGGRVTGTWQHSREDAGIRFPRADDGSRFPGQVQTQFGTDSVLRASFLASPHIILGGYGRITYSPSGRDAALGISLAVPFGARSAVFSSDLPHFADRSWP